MDTVWVWCSDCGHRFTTQDPSNDGWCPDCGGNVIIEKTAAQVCTECNSCPAVDPENGLHMCAECGNAYMHGF